MNLPGFPVEESLEIARDNAARNIAKRSVARSAVACFVLTLFVPLAIHAQACKGNTNVGCLNSGAACSPVTTGSGSSGHCANPGGFPKGERSCECVGTPIPPPPLLDPRCSDRTATGTFTCTIDEPNVRQLETQYPAVQFAPGDTVEVNANGCVQTGGHGLTWKRYVNPSGDNSDRLYHGLIRIPTGTKNGQLVRIQSLGSSPLTVTGAGVPLSELVLYLGYEDDGYSDNGYDHHDNGAGDQCQTDPTRNFDGGPAHVTITITRGPGVPVPTPTSTFDFDVLWTQTDPNGLPYNPQWSWQLNPQNGGKTPHRPQTSICHNFSYRPTILGIPDGALQPDFGDCTDQPDQATVDLPQGTNKPVCTYYGLFTSDSFAGHVNWFPVTMEGTAGSVSHDYIGDDDYTFGFISDVTDALDVNGRDYVHVEFDSDETIDNYDSIEWHALHLAVDNVSERAAQIFKGHTILTGMFGLDGEHDLKSEMHPLFAMATKRTYDNDDPSDEDWLIFVRNQGDEGYCSSQIWNAGFEDYTFRLPWRSGMTDVDVNRIKTQFKFGGTATGPVVAKLPPPAASPGVYVTFHLGPPVPRKTSFGGDPDATYPFVNGALHLTWSSSSPDASRQAITASGVHKSSNMLAHPLEKINIETEPTGEVNEAEGRIGLSAGKLTPAQQLQVKNARAQMAGPPAIGHDGGVIGPVTRLQQAPRIPKLGKPHAIKAGLATRKLQRDAAQIRALCAASNNVPAGLPPGVCTAK